MAIGNIEIGNTSMMATLTKMFAVGIKNARSSSRHTTCAKAAIWDWNVRRSSDTGISAVRFILCWFVPRLFARGKGH